MNYRERSSKINLKIKNKFLITDHIHIKGKSNINQFYNLKVRKIQRT